MTNAYVSTRLSDCGAEAGDLLNRIGKSNPFYTLEFARAMQALGREVWTIRSAEEISPAGVALGFVRRGRLSAELEFVSMPTAAGSVEFWDEVNRLAKREGITDITAGSFASCEFELPKLPGEVSRRNRPEFLLPLDNVELPSLLSSNHKRNAKKAAKAEVTVRRTRDCLDWLPQHCALMGHSADRRMARGESVSMSAEMSDYRAFLQNGAAEVFQAMRGTDEVLSSVLILRSPSMAYYQSAGTSADGMSIGASHFLILSIAEALQAEGCREFNLGGAADGSSLARFKAGFGAREVVLPSALCYVGPVWKRWVRNVMQRTRSSG